MGAGFEENIGKGDTPGFQTHEDDRIERDDRGHNKWEPKRNSNRMVTTSLHCVRSWRGNCKVDIILYNSDPENPDPQDVANVADYAVSYSCKGNTTPMEEKRQARDLIRGCEEETGNELDVMRVSRKIMNSGISDRTTCKEECVVLLSGLDLFTCSESIVSVSLSGWCKLDKKQNSTIMSKCRFRNLKLHRHKSLNECFFVLHPTRFYPHCTGSHHQAACPPTEDHARSVMLVHKPWSGDELPGESGEWIDTFNEFLNSSHCPKSVKINCERAKQKFISDRVHAECVAGEVDEHDDDDAGNDNLGGDMQRLLDFCASMPQKSKDGFELRGRNFNRGLDCKWNRELKEARNSFIFAQSSNVSPKFILVCFGRMTKPFFYINLSSSLCCVK